MSNHKSNKIAIVILGYFPPPFGGITIHTKRLYDFLLSNQINVSIISEYKNYAGIKALIVLIKGIVDHARNSYSKNRLIHFHSPSKEIRLFLGFCSLFGIRTMITLHGAGIKDQVEKNGVIWRLIYVSMLKKINFIICDNEDLKRYMNKIGISEKRTKVISAFIPPTIIKMKLDLLPRSIIDFYNKHEINIFAMGWIKFHHGTDLYGLDMILSLAEKLNDIYSSRVSVVIKLMLTDIQDDNYYTKWLRRSRLLKNTLVITEDLVELYPLEKMASLVIRPSCTDGDSVSIRESLFFNTPVIASDAVPRPKGCILFRNRDMDDFQSTTISVVEKLIKKGEISIPKQCNNAEKILKVYYEQLININ